MFRLHVIYFADRIDVTNHYHLTGITDNIIFGSNTIQYKPSYAITARTQTLVNL